MLKVGLGLVSITTGGFKDELESWGSKVRVYKMKHKQGWWMGQHSSLFSGGSPVRSSRTPANRTRFTLGSIPSVTSVLAAYQSHIWNPPCWCSSPVLWPIALYATGLVDDTRNVKREYFTLQSLPHVAILRAAAEGHESYNRKFFLMLYGWTEWSCTNSRITERQQRSIH